MGQMAIQGVIYNIVTGAGFPGRSSVGTRGHRPSQGLSSGGPGRGVMGSWALVRVVRGFFCSRGGGI